MIPKIISIDCHKRLCNHTAKKWHCQKLTMILLALARAWSMPIPPWAMVAAISNSFGSLLTALELFIAFWKFAGHSSSTKLLMMVHW